MTAISDFYREDCSKIDPSCVNAYFELELDPTDDSVLMLDSSWGTTKIDLEPAVKDSETETTLKLSPAQSPTYLEYIGENGVPQCIYGEDLARIIPMTKLKDVNQVEEIGDGDVYMFNSISNVFEPYDLKSFVENTNQAIQNINAQISAMQNAINVLQGQVEAIQQTIARPDGVPQDTRIVYGNINLISDPTNSNNKNKGLFTHTTAEDRYADEFFA